MENLDADIDVSFEESRSNPVRPEGNLQFGDDWPGLFLRGDECFGLKLQLNNVIEFLEKRRDEETEDWLIAKYNVNIRFLESMVKKLATSDVNQTTHSVILLKPFAECLK